MQRCPLFDKIIHIGLTAVIHRFVSVNQGMSFWRLHAWQSLADAILTGWCVRSSLIARYRSKM